MSYWAAGAAIGSAVIGAAGGISGNKAARKATREQARNTFDTRMEEIRRQKIENEYVLGQNKAAVHASNIQMSGSSKRAIQGMQSSFAQDIQWRQRAAQKERSAIRAGAPGGTANLAVLGQAGASIAGSIGGAINNG